MFAAYSKKDDTEPSSENVSSSGWLKSGSFVFGASSETPIPQEFQQTISSSETYVKSKSKKKSKEKDSHKKSHKYKHKKNKEDHSKKTRDVKEENLPLPKGTIFSSPGMRQDMCFYQDCTGDRNNLAFPKLYYKNVAKYKLIIATISVSIRC